MSIFDRKSRKDSTEDDAADSPTTPVDPATLAGVAVEDRSGPEPPASNGETSGTQEIGVEFAGQDLGGVDENLEGAADEAAAAGSDDPGGAGKADIENAKGGNVDWLFSAGDGAGSNAPPGTPEEPTGPPPAPGDRRDLGDEATGTAEGASGLGQVDEQVASFINPLAGSSNEGGEDPVSSWIDAVEGKTGIDVGGSPDEQTDPTPGIGKDAIAGDFVNDAKKGAESAKNNISDPSSASTPTGQAMRQALDEIDGAEKNTSKDGVVTSTKRSDGSIEVTNKENGTTTLLKPDGSTVTSNTETGKVIDTTKAVKDPGPDGEYGDLPPEFEAQLAADVAAMKAAQQAGGGGDGATDPSDADDPNAGTPVADVPDLEQVKLDMIGQPVGDSFTGERSVGSEAGFYNHSNTGALDPADDQNMPGGPQRNEDPGDAFGSNDPLTGIPAEDPAAGAGDGTVTFLPPSSDIAGPADAPPELPDPVDVP